MRGKTICLSVALTLFPLGLSARGIYDTIAKVDSASAEGWHSTADYRVQLPQRDDDVHYQVELTQQSAPGDTLFPVSYLIGWRYGDTEGFSAYFDGHHYRYNGRNRLQEYHFSANNDVFRPRPVGNRRTPGVHENAQFVGLLPALTAKELREIAADTLHWTLQERNNADGSVTLTAEMYAGCEGRDNGCTLRKTWNIGPDGNLRRYLSENNIGQISEQSVEVSYRPGSHDVGEPLSEERLLMEYPEVFGRYRESNFRVGSLEGTPLPGFSMPTLTGERYTYTCGEGFRAPTLLALLDPEHGVTAPSVALLRKAADAGSRPIDLIIAFTGTDIAAAEAVAGYEAHEGEHILLNAAKTARDFGAANLPVILICRPDGTVAKVVEGLNPELPSIVVNTLI